MSSQKNSSNTKAAMASRTHESNKSRNASLSGIKGPKNIKGTLSSVNRSNTAVSASKRNQHQPNQQPTVDKHPLRNSIQIFDEEGNDVTPLPLLNTDPALMKKTQQNVIGDGSMGTPTDIMSITTTSIYGQAVGMTSAFGGGPFTRSVFTQSFETNTDSIPPDESSSPDFTTFAEVRHKRQEVQEIPTAEDLHKVVDITLTETDTIWLFDLPDVKVSVESEEASAVEARNVSYAELQKSRIGNDLYAERGMNTFNEPPKLKSVATSKIEMVHASAECTHFDMFDAFQESNNLNKALTRLSDESTHRERLDSTASTTSGSHSSNRRSSSEHDARTPRSEGLRGENLMTSLETMTEHTEAQRLVHEWDALVKSGRLTYHLFLMERVINLNSYQPKQALYRGLKTAISEKRTKKTGKATESSQRLIAKLESDMVMDVVMPEKGSPSQIVHDLGPNLDRLWSYNCNLTKGHNVSCIAWNPANLDLVAIGYGQFEFNHQKPGLVCCWCIKNPEFPERIFTSKQGVTALDFSRANANLLAVGYYDGGIAIYNVRKTLDDPVLDNFTTHGKHIAPVWQLKWIDKERGSGDEQSEVLISISTDGRVTQWSIRKGFESYDVMKLKKMPTRMGGRSREKKGEAFISRFAGGMCFDFHDTEPNIYLAGTEEGYIHKCSCSHNEQYLESYYGHTGPVYTIKWSPFVSGIFLSCSADWTMKLWQHDLTKPILSFQSSTKAVNDVCWSPWSSTVFACVNESAVEVWDLSQSTLDAVYTLVPPSHTTQTAVSFSQNSQCLLVGDNEGQVTVYELRCMPPPKTNQVEELMDIIKASLASQLPSDSSNTDKENADQADKSMD